MKRCYGIIAILMGTAFSAFAGIPNQNMSATSLGIEYTGFLRGQTITSQMVPTHERFQSLYLHYAPVEYIVFSVGAGIDRLSVDPSAGVSFGGKYGFAPGARVSLYTPRLFDLVSLTAAGDFIYFSSTDEHSYTYASPVFDPYGGVKFSFANCVDLEVGARGHFMYGQMKNEKAGGAQKFSNNKIVRGYMGFTLYSALAGAYLTLYGDASPAISSDLSKGPYEGTLGLSIGTIIKTAGFGAKSEGLKKDPYFPSYQELKKKQEKMAREVQ